MQRWCTIPSTIHTLYSKSSSDKLAIRLLSRVALHLQIAKLLTTNEFVLTASAVADAKPSRQCSGPG
jgi:hypothetical protein